jgi:hypothetical protein
MPGWLEHTWVGLVIGFIFIGILLDAVLASREAISGLVKSIRKKRAAKKVEAKD